MIGFLDIYILYILGQLSLLGICFHISIINAPFLNLCTSNKSVHKYNLSQYIIQFLRNDQIHVSKILVLYNS